MSLLVVGADNPDDVNAWSGIPASVVKALRDHVEVHTLHLGVPRRSLPHAACRLVLGQTRYPLWMTTPALKRFGARLDAAVARVGPQAVLSISSQGLIYSRADVPKFMFSDAPWITWRKTYQAYAKKPLLCDRFARKETAAARKADGLIFGSAWARDRALAEYGVASDHVFTIPLGANWTPSVTARELKARILERLPEDATWSLDQSTRQNKTLERRFDPVGTQTAPECPAAPLKLLFVGRDWDRKGGPLALEITQELCRRGMPSKLHIVGCNPVLGETAESVCVRHGFLSRSDPRQRRCLEDLFLASHLLLMPTKAECFGISFAEAQAFGLPPVAFALDALPTVVEDGVTGLLLPRDSDAKAFADAMTALMGGAGRYTAMCFAARRRYLARLSWSAFASRLLEIMALRRRGA